MSYPEFDTWLSVRVGVQDMTVRLSDLKSAYRDDAGRVVATVGDGSEKYVLEGVTWDTWKRTIAGVAVMGDPDGVASPGARIADALERLAATHEAQAALAADVCEVSLEAVRRGIAARDGEGG